MPFQKGWGERTDQSESALALPTPSQIPLTWHSRTEVVTSGQCRFYLDLRILSTISAQILYIHRDEILRPPAGGVLQTIVFRYKEIGYILRTKHRKNVTLSQIFSIL
jgi:hypothetical protein